MTLTLAVLAAEVVCMWHLTECYLFSSKSEHRMNTLSFVMVHFSEHYVALWRLPLTFCPKIDLRVPLLWANFLSILGFLDFSFSFIDK